MKYSLLNGPKLLITLSEGISIDNTTTEIDFYEPYQATITSSGNGYLLHSITLKMDGQEIPVDEATRDNKYSTYYW